MVLSNANLTALFADADVAALIASITALFDNANDLPIQTIAAQAAASTRRSHCGQRFDCNFDCDASAAKVAAQSVDAKVPGTVRTARPRFHCGNGPNVAIRDGLALTSELQPAVTAALNGYDPPTRTEATSDKQSILIAIDDLIETEVTTIINPDSGYRSH